VLTLLVVSGFVAAASYNRGGDPRMTLIVTERELSLPYDPEPAPDDDPGLQLQLEIDRRDDPLDARNWLTEDRLRALGFGLHVPAGSPEAERRYRTVPPRVGWVVFEYGGPAWTEIARRRALTTDARARTPIEATRLVPVDAGPDFDALQARYPSGHLILRAVITLMFRNAQSGGPVIYGYVRELVPSTVTVPRHLRPIIEGLKRPRLDSVGGQSPVAPRYEAEVAVGRLGIPYLRAIRRLGQ
jgi:hypothetical protein